MGTDTEKKTNDKIPRVENPEGDIPSGFEVSEEASIANDVTGAYLNIPTGVTPGGKATLLRSIESVSDSQYTSLRLFIPKDSRTDISKLVVLYRVIRDNGRTYVGLIPGSQLQMTSTAIMLQPKGQGIYQAAVLPIFLDEAREQEVIDGPKLIKHSQYRSQGSAMDIVLANSNMAYLADTNGLEALNWSPSQGLSLSYRIPAATGAVIQAVHSEPPRIYVAAGAAGVGLLVTTDPNRTLVLQGTSGVTNALATAPNLSKIFLAQEGNTNPLTMIAGLARMDIQGAVPVYETVATIPEGNQRQPYYAVQIRDNWMYVLGRRMLQVFDITLIQSFTATSLINLDGQADKFVLMDTRAYVIDKQMGIDVIDVSNPGSELRRLGRYPMPNLVDIGSYGRYVIIADNTGRISLLEASNPTRLEVRHTVEVEGVPTRVRVFGDYVFVTLGSGGIQVLRIQ